MSGSAAMRLTKPDGVGAPPHAGFWASRRRQRTAKMFFVYLLLLSGAVAVCIPFVWMVSTSLKNLGQVFLFPPQWIPQPFGLAQLLRRADRGAVRPFLPEHRHHHGDQHRGHHALPVAWGPRILSRACAGAAARRSS